MSVPELVPSHVCTYPHTCALTCKIQFGFCEKETTFLGVACNKLDSQVVLVLSASCMHRMMMQGRLNGEVSAITVPVTSVCI